MLRNIAQTFIGAVAVCTILWAGPAGEQTPGTIQTKIIFLRPPSFRVAMTMQLRQAAAAVFNARMSISQLSAGVAGARTAYWKAYATKGPALENARAMFAEALFEKDYYYLVNRLATQGVKNPFQGTNKGVEQLLSLLGKVDSDIDPEVAGAFEGWVTSVRNALNAGATDALAAALSGTNASYARYQVARDTFEFYRSPFSPLRSADYTVFMGGVIAARSHFTLTPERALDEYAMLRAALTGAAVDATVTRMLPKTGTIFREDRARLDAFAEMFDDAFEPDTTQLKIVKLLYHQPLPGGEWASAYKFARDRYDMLAKRHGEASLNRVFTALTAAKSVVTTSSYQGVVVHRTLLEDPRAFGCETEYLDGCMEEILARPGADPSPAPMPSTVEALEPLITNPTGVSLKAMYDAAAAKQYEALWLEANSRRPMGEGMARAEPISQPTDGRAIDTLLGKYRVLCAERRAGQGAEPDACRISAALVDLFASVTERRTYASAKADGGVPGTQINQIEWGGADIIVRTLAPVSMADVPLPGYRKQMSLGPMMRGRLEQTLRIGTDNEWNKPLVVPAGSDAYFIPVRLDSIVEQAQIDRGGELWLLLDSVVVHKRLSDGFMHALLIPTDRPVLARTIAQPDASKARWMYTKAIPANSVVTFELKPWPRSREIDLLASLGGKFDLFSRTQRKDEFDYISLDQPVDEIPLQTSLDWWIRERKSREGGDPRFAGPMLGEPTAAYDEQMVVPATARFKKSEKQLVHFTFWGRFGLGVAKREPDRVIWVRIVPTK